MAPLKGSKGPSGSQEKSGNVAASHSPDALLKCHLNARYLLLLVSLCCRECLKHPAFID